MPIKGLTDQGADFPLIGHIRKGEEKTENRPGKDLDYFRVEFNEGEEKAAETFRQVYGDEPRKINIRLMFNEIDRFWEAWDEAYTSGALVHRCNGEFVQYAIDPSNGALLVREGLSVETGEPVPCLGYAVKKDGKPYKTGKGKKIECKHTGRLRVIIPELRRFACLMVHTTSLWDVINISSNLKGIEWSSGGRLQGLPCILRRVLDNKSTPGPNGKRIRRDMWLIKIEVSEDWVAAKLLESRAASFPALPAPAEAPTEIIEGEVVNVTTGEILEEADIEPGNGTEEEVRETVTEEETVAEPKTTNGDPTRPWQPDLLKEKMLIAVEKKANWRGEPNKGQLGLLAGRLEEVWAGDKGAKANRQEFLGWMTGKRSVKDLGLPWVATLLKWLLKDPATGDYPYTEYGPQEARLVYNRAMLDQGQLEIPLEDETTEQPELEMG